MSELNVRIRQAIDSFDVENARKLLRDALKEANAETYYLASLVALDDRQRQSFLEKALEIDPFHADAYTALNTASSEGAETNADSEEDGIYVTGTILNSAVDRNLYIIPHKSGPVRTTLEPGSKIRIFERDDFDEWYYIEYVSTLGTEIYGWMPVNSVSDLHVEDIAVKSSDLPITEFRQNIREDVLELINLKKQNVSSMVNDASSTFEVVLSTPGRKIINVIKIVYQNTGLGLAEAKKLVESTPQTVVTGISRAQAENIQQELEKQGATVQLVPIEKSEEELAIERQIKRLEKIQLEKRNEYEIWQDALEREEQSRKLSLEEQRAFQREMLQKQRNHEMLQQGIGIAGNLLSRSVSDKKKITHEYRSKK